MPNEPGPHPLDEMLHPVRMRIMLALAGTPGLTSLQLATRLDDVPQATLYRQIGRLAKAGLLAVVEERQVRGTLEKVYALNPRADMHLDNQAFAGLSKEDHLRYFNAFTVTLVDAFARYLKHTPRPDLAADGVGYTQVVVAMSDAELAAFAQTFNQAIAPYANQAGDPDHKRRILATILLPEVSGNYTERK